MLIFCATTFVHAQFVYKSGYVLLLNGDSVKGDIRVNTKKELTMFQKVGIKVGDATKNYKPEQVKEYSYETTKFVARKVDGEMQFLKVISSGRINLYELQFEVQRGNDLVVDSDYYMEKNDGTNAEPQKVKKFKKAVADMMSDNTDLVARVQSDDKKYEVADMAKVVEEYNSWFDKQNGTLQGSR